MNIDLSQKRILITGASRGIGRALAINMAEAGATVAAHFHQSKNHAESLFHGHPNNIHLFQADFSKEAAAGHLMDRVVDSLGGLDVLINNAAVALHSPLSQNDEDWWRQWDQTMQVNLKAAALLCKKALPIFEKQKAGIIINISSRAAFRGDTPEYLAYAASKGGLVSLTRSLARAYGKHGVVAFNVAPGFVKTDMAQDFVEQYGESLVLKDLALDHLTRPQDIAPMVTLLASGLANHATGCTIDINAGSYIH